MLTLEDLRELLMNHLTGAEKFHYERVSGDEQLPCTPPPEHEPESCPVGPIPDDAGREALTQLRELTRAFNTIQETIRASQLSP